MESQPRPLGKSSTATYMRQTCDSTSQFHFFGLVSSASTKVAHFQKVKFSCCRRKTTSALHCLLRSEESPAECSGSSNYDDAPIVCLRKRPHFTYIPGVTIFLDRKKRMSRPLVSPFANATYHVFLWWSISSLAKLRCCMLRPPVVWSRLRHASAEFTCRNFAGDVACLTPD